MTRFLLVLLLLLPLAVMVGCGDPSNSDDDDTSIGDDDDDSVAPAFEATLRSVAPYGWAGDHFVAPVSDTSPDPDCMSVSECDVAVEEANTQRVRLSGWNFACVSQDMPLREDQNGETISLDWTGEGVCGLAPEGEGDGLEVSTEIKSYLNGFDQVTIEIESWGAVVTGNSFFYQSEGLQEDYLLEGTIEDDLSSISFYLGAPETSGEMDTIDLEE